MKPELPILFTVPYAGGHSMVFRNLKTMLQDTIQVETLEPPGRGKRANEPLMNDLNQIAEDMYGQIVKITNGRPFSVLGHSMGALIAYLISKRALEKDKESVVHLFCSGHIAPIVPKIEPGETPRYKANSTEFWAYIESLGALPPELKAHEELMSYFEPIVRADIQALESYVYEKPEVPLNVPLTVFYGISDIETPIHKLLPWQSETTMPVKFIPQPGGHFGFFENLDYVSTYIQKHVSD
jgi:surfactin synthase thioesterase subunit